MLPVRKLKSLSALASTAMSLRRLSTNITPKTGIVMLNMGGPPDTSHVYDYLLRIMTDTDMIQFPVMQNQLGQLIAKKRTAEVQKKYEEIGGGSPILQWTKRQGELLCKRLDKLSPSTAPHKYYISFRYVKPFTEDAFSEVERDGVKRVVIFSQYPQYSCATAGSSFNAIYRYYRNRTLPKDMKFSVIDRWATHPLFVKTHADLIRKEIWTLSKEQLQDAIILFSAHSLPLKAVNRGDSYPSEVGATVNAVMQELNFSMAYQLVWQSKVGPLPWLGPFTDEAIKDYVKKGKKSFIVVPIAFVNEHIETLHELDIEYCKELAEKVGVERILRTPAPNDHHLFIEALADIVKSHLEGSTSVSRKFLNRCPHCDNMNCQLSKRWFSKVCKC